MRIKDSAWIAFFSHSGSEIVKLASVLGRWPDLIVTDAPPSQWHPDLLDEEKFNGQIKQVHKKPTAEQYRVWFKEPTQNYVGYPIITLHGWMNIIPRSICENYEIYNGHPGLVDHFPELKGKDAQAKVVGDTEGNYPVIGSVVHVVTPIIDDGEILYKSATFNPYVEEEVYETLRNTSLLAWLKFFFDEY